MLDRLAARYRALGPDFHPPPGGPPAALDAFERDNGVRLPAAMRDLYARFDGLPHGECDGFIFDIYPLANLYNVLVLDLLARGSPDLTGIAELLPNAANHYVFADLMIGSTYYAVKLSPDPEVASPVVAVGPDTSWRERTASFGEFVRLLADDPGRVLFG